MHHASSLFLALGALALSSTAPLCAADNTLTPEQRAEGWIALFDGKTLDGWSVKSGFATYRVEDGAIVGTTVTNSPNSFLVTDKTFRDYELTFEVLLDNNELNSGVQTRSRLKGDLYGGRVFGPQIEIEAAPGQAGYVYGEAAGGWLSPEPKAKDKGASAHSAFKNKAWNQYRVRAVGPKIETWVNGQKIADLTHEAKLYAENQEGFFGLQVHGVGKKGPFSVRWKNIYVKPLAETK